MQNQLIYGDCFDIMDGFPDDIFDAIITDPPYFNTHLDFDKSKFDWKDLWKIFKRIIKPNGVIAVFSQYRPSLEVVGENFNQFRYHN